MREISTGRTLGLAVPTVTIRQPSDNIPGESGRNFQPKLPDKMDLQLVVNALVDLLGTSAPPCGMDLWVRGSM